MTRTEAQRWADANVKAKFSWAYSDGWLMVYDPQFQHVMLARLDSERLRDVWDVPHAESEEEK